MRVPTVTRREVIGTLRHMGRMFPTHYYTAFQVNQLLSADDAQVEHMLELLARLRVIERKVSENKGAYRVPPEGP